MVVRDTVFTERVVKVRSDKQSSHARWAQLSVPQRSGWLTGLIALGATLTAISATQLEAPFWQGFLTGVWSTGTAVLIGWLVAIQIAARNHKADN